MAVDGAFGPDVPVFVELQRRDEDRRWLATLPALVETLEREWGIETGRPFSGGMASWVAPATRADGSPAVLKLNPPHREAREEITALELWEGRAAVSLYRADRDRGALLVERCRPGLALDRAGLKTEDALRAGAVVLSELWRTPVPLASRFELLADVTAEWAGGVRTRMAHYRPPFDPGLVELGAELLGTLPASGRTVVLHGDFNPGNVLSAERAPWLAIDAKPMIGDAAYDPAPLLAQIDDPFEKPDPRREVLARYRLFAEVVEQPAERMLAWAAARNVECALWYVDRDDLPRGEACMRAATVAARLAGL